MADQQEKTILFDGLTKLDDISDHSDAHSDGKVDSSSNVEGSTPAGRNDGEQNKAEVKRMSARESTRITLFKVILIGMILAAATLVTTGAYKILSREEDDDFYSSFDQFTKTIENAAKFHLNTLYTAVTELSVQITAKAMVSGQEWPFVTLPEFEAMTQGIRRQTGFEVISFVPFVEPHQVDEWQSYSWQHQYDWVTPSHTIALSSFKNSQGYTIVQPSSYPNTTISPKIWNIRGAETLQESDPLGPYGPQWQRSPPPTNLRLINLNMRFLQGEVGWVVNASMHSREGLFGAVRNYGEVADASLTKEIHEEFHSSLLRDAPHLNLTSSYERPHCTFAFPIFEQVNDLTSKVVGIISSRVAWDWFLVNLLPETVRGILLVLKNTCNQAYTYEIVGETAVYMGEGDLHDPAYQYTEVVIPFHRLRFPESTPNFPGHCLYSFHLYATSDFEDNYVSKLPVTLSVVIAATFVFMAFTFFLYDFFVRRRNEIVVDAAAKSNAIVSSLFPDAFKSRLMEHSTSTAQVAPRNSKALLKRYITEGDDNQENLGDDQLEGEFMFKTKPIADLFTETTILFSDIAGFTSWSSTREPSQVFILLETIYHAFDEIAKKRHVYKVETVGDSYVAATGIPEARPDHAVLMARFARDCLEKFQDLVHRLEVILGPDTADLAIRIGVHSGPVTAGVLRGERSRFQLFGDTMNTASRMESTGVRNKIQISQETADLLDAAGKSSWYEPREEKVVAKGKGELQTYWLHVRSRRARSAGDDVSCSFTSTETGTILSEKIVRMVNWNVDLLSKLLRSVLSHRKQQKPNKRAVATSDWSQLTSGKGKTVLDEVKEIIRLPDFDAKKTTDKEMAEEIELGPVVMEQLTDLVTSIAIMYRDNPFHNFEHASHVTMAVTKFMSRIVAPEFGEEELQTVNGNESLAAMLHDYTYGITSDPLTQFACVFSSLIHDVDHTGVPNTQLVKENEVLASYYRGKSVAEQNSIDLSWSLLLDDKYRALRELIAPTDVEQERFRQLVVNSVMATDIMDKDLKKLRNDRWDKAFSEEVLSVGSKKESAKDQFDRKATIVIEHLIQASDVAHTMQHWHIYRKWNERLFEEMYRAFLQGRSENDPSEFWYKGEIGFFDYYIIPLAKKLKDCGVFGVSSSECLDYAQKNREEWINRGEQVVAEMVEKVKGTMTVEEVMKGMN